MLRTSFLIAALAASVFAGIDEDFSELRINSIDHAKSTPLAKPGKAALSSYSNSTFNVNYSAPSGFTFLSSAISIGTYLRIYPITNPLYPTVSMQIVVYKLNTNNEADYFNKVISGSIIKTVYNSTSTQAPLVYSYLDTLIGAYRYTTIKMKNLENNTIFVSYSESNGLYVLNFSYSTTISDFNGNSEAYVNNWYGVNFISTVALKAAAKSFIKKPSERPVNALGQTISEKESRWRAIKFIK